MMNLIDNYIFHWVPKSDFPRCETSSNPEITKSTPRKVYPEIIDLTSEEDIPQTTVNAGNPQNGSKKRQLQTSNDAASKPPKPKKKKIGEDFHTEVDLICMVCASKKCPPEECRMYTYHLRHDRIFQNPFFKCPKCGLSKCMCVLLKNCFYRCQICSLPRCECYEPFTS